MKDLPKRKILRRKDRDYSQNGMYFITFCTHNKTEYLGRIVNLEHQTHGGIYNERLNEMLLNGYGIIVKSLISALEFRYENVIVECYCIMPNHVHMIVEITDDSALIDMERCNPRNLNLISKLIGFLKMNSAKQIRQLNPAIPCVWQRGFYDHIIRNENEHRVIKKYIETNHKRWLADIFYPTKIEEDTINE